MAAQTAVDVVAVNVVQDHPVQKGTATKTVDCIDCRVFAAVFQQHFSYIMAANALIHAFLEFLLQVLRTIFFPSHWMLFHIVVVEKLDGYE